MIPGLGETLFLVLLLTVSSGDGRNDRFLPCLPEGTDLEEVVLTTTLKQPTGVTSKNVTMKDRLRQLKAHCKKGKLVTGSGREIRFYRLLGCWGNPPDDYQEQLARQEQELQRLKKKYSVIEIPCAQLDPRQIH